MAPFRTDIKSETMWCATFDGNPLTIDILLDFFLKAHADNCEPSIQRQGKGKILGSVQPVIQALLYYLANASQISQLEDLLQSLHVQSFDACTPTLAFPAFSLKCSAAFKRPFRPT